MKSVKKNKVRELEEEAKLNFRASDTCKTPLLLASLVAALSADAREKYEK